ncbi:MAG: SDR family NAD(P)-dependent oxidoreductase [Salinisphaera sp.]|nr:SDR family NAD(P)-dependent oxidoreductase [Salinisphaera sp.]
MSLAKRAVAVTFITGASSGIGRSLALRFARRGHAVGLLARGRPALEELADEIRALGGRAHVVVADVTERQAVMAAAAEIEHELGAITCVIANAGGGVRTDVNHFDAETIESTIRLNLIGVVNTVAGVLPAMQARGSGQLVAMGSLAGSRGLPSAAAYSAAKAGVANFMESLRIDLRGTGIAVTLLVPGFVATKPGKRKRFSMELEQATGAMEKAILARQARWAAPIGLTLAAGMLRLIPTASYDWLMAGHGKRRKLK